MHVLSRWQTAQSLSIMGLLISALVLALPFGAAAQTKPAKGWDSKVKGSQSGPAGKATRILTPQQMKSIEAVNTFFNAVEHLRGRFSQTNPDKTVQRGKFYVKRPGRFRFEYNRPSRQVIISDGTYLAIQDPDIDGDDVYGLENTPFRIVLRKNVDLIRDARIMAVEQTNSQIAVTITDKSPDSPGQITIYLTNEDNPALAGWVTTDVQGGVTKVAVTKLERPAKLSAKLFKRQKLFMKSIQ